MGIIISGSTAVDNDTLVINNEGQIQANVEMLPMVYDISKFLIEETTNNESIDIENLERGKKYLIVVSGNENATIPLEIGNNVSSSTIRINNLTSGYIKNGSSSNNFGSLRVRYNSTGYVVFQASSDIILLHMFSIWGDIDNLISARIATDIDETYTLNLINNTRAKFKIYELK